MITLANYLDWKTNDSVKKKDYKESLAWSLIADFAISTIATLAICFA